MEAMPTSAAQPPPREQKASACRDSSKETYALIPPPLPPPTHLTPSLKNRNKKHLAPSRPLLHLPPFLLHGSHWYRMGNRLHQLRLLYHPPHTSLHIRAFPAGVGSLGNGELFSSWEIIGERGEGIAGKAEEGTVS
ncbi:hypothetical protein ACLMJK_000055 [Lecanora helva]